MFSCFIYCFKRLLLQKATAASFTLFKLSIFRTCWRISPPEADEPVYQRNEHVYGFMDRPLNLLYNNFCTSLRACPYTIPRTYKIYNNFISRSEEFSNPGNNQINAESQQGDGSNTPQNLIRFGIDFPGCCKSNDQSSQATNKCTEKAHDEAQSQNR